MRRYSVLVDTVEVHTRRYEVDADSKQEAKARVRDGQSRGGISFCTEVSWDYADTDDAFKIVEIVEV